MVYVERINPSTIIRDDGYGLVRLWLTTHLLDSIGWRNVVVYRRAVTKSPTVSIDVIA